jgi:tetratricopeptide (TPR) repeat protein
MAQQVPTDRYLRILATLFVTAATFVLFSPTLDNDFIGWDDGIYIVDNPHLSPLSFHLVATIFSGVFYHSYTPLTILGHALVVRAFGLDPRGHHLANLVFHAANAALVFLLASWILSRRAGLRGLRGDPLRATLPRPAVHAGGIGAALFFAFSPIRLESVLAASSLKDVLSAFLALGSILCYLRHTEERDRKPAGPFLWLAFLFFVLGLLAKSAIAALPGILILLDIVAEGGWRRHLTRGRILEKVPFLLASGGVLLVGFIATAAAPGAGSSVAVKTDIPTMILGMFNLGFYVVKSVWPGGTVLVYVIRPGPGMYACAALGVFVTVVVVVLWRRGFRGSLYAWAAYLILILPLAYFIPTTAQPTAARYAYFSTIPFAVLFGSGVAWWMARAEGGLRAAPWAVALLLPGLLGFHAFRQIGWWKDGETIWRHTIAENPPHAFLFQQMGHVKTEKGEHDSSRVYYALALSLDTNSASIRCNIAAASLAMGDTGTAAAYLGDRRVMRLEEPLRYITLGTLRLQQGRKEEALAAFQRSAAIDPASFQSHYDAAYTWNLLGETGEAIKAVDIALVLNPGLREAHYLKGLLLEKDPGGGAGGWEEYRVAARLGHPQAQKRLLELGQVW